MPSLTKILRLTVVKCGGFSRRPIGPTAARPIVAKGGIIGREETMNPTSWLIALVLVGCAMACLALPSSAGANKAKIDFAESRHVDDWLRHPVYGDPSFDSFERLAGNPIYRGSREFAWPVNGFLFID